MADECWRPIADFPAYEVSDHGRIRRMKASTGARVGQILRPARKPSGHLFVLLRTDGKGHARRVHTLVAAAFIGACPDGTEVDHKDFDPGNNHWTNLQYLTHADNNRKSAAAGRIKPPVKRGEQSHSSKLTDDQVRKIRRRYRDGESRVAIARAFGIAVNHVWNIATGKAWSHVAD